MLMSIGMNLFFTCGMGVIRAACTHYERQNNAQTIDPIILIQFSKFIFHLLFIIYQYFFNTAGSNGKAAEIYRINRSWTVSGKTGKKSEIR
jgi:uncharacterized membrane-anchored protein